MGCDYYESDAQVGSRAARGPALGPRPGSPRGRPGAPPWQPAVLHCGAGPPAAPAAGRALETRPA